MAETSSGKLGPVGQRRRAVVPICRLREEDAQGRKAETDYAFLPPSGGGERKRESRGWLWCVNKVSGARYRVSLGDGGDAAAWCTCPDFERRRLHQGGECKHILALSVLARLVAGAVAKWPGEESSVEKFGKIPPKSVDSGK